jgi:hypothetical protein
MITLYEMTDQYKQLVELADSSDDPAEQQAFSDTLESLEGEIEEKLHGCAIVVKTIDANVDALEAEIDRLTARAKGMKGSRDRLKLYMETSMTTLGIEKVKGKLYTVAMQNNPPKVEITDETAVTDAYIFVVTSPDKKKMADDLKAGVVVPGAQLVRTKSLRIR